MIRDDGYRPKVGVVQQRPRLLARLKRRVTRFPDGLGLTAKAPLAPVMSSDRWSSSSAKGSSLLTRWPCQPYSRSSSALRSGRVSVIRRVMSLFSRPGIRGVGRKPVASKEEKLDEDTCLV